MNLLYPVPNTDNLSLPADVYPAPSDKGFTPPSADLCIEKLFDVLAVRPKFIFLSVNRYERKKNIELAINSFGKRQLIYPTHYLLDKFVTSCF